MRGFTPEERAELARADAEIDAEFVQTQEEIEASRKRDRQAKLDALDNKGRKIAAQQAAYREANREKYNAYMREYMRKRREKNAIPAMS